VKLSDRRALRKGLENPVNEALLLTILSAPSIDEGQLHIVKSLANFDSGHYSCIVLEFCSGGELFDVIPSINTPLNLDTMRRWMRDVALGIQFCHSKSICHLDLSLENVLVDDKQNLKICDFGMAKQGFECCFADYIPGKLRYRAPEVQKNIVFDGAAADVWSLGSIFFIMLTGGHPYDEPNPLKDVRFRYLMTKGKLGLLKILASSSPTDFPESVVDLLSHMLCSVKLRYTIAEVLNHHFLHVQ